MAGEGACSGLRVLDLSEGFAGALCTMILGDNGAAVVRVTAPADEEQDPAAAVAGARQWHRSKEVRRLDVRADAGRAECMQLLAEADVVVTTAGGWIVEQLSLSPDATLAANPSAIVCHIDGFGRHPTLGGLPPYEGAVVAAAGRMLDMGGVFGLSRPAVVGPPLANFGAATASVHAICAALHRRYATGRTQGEIIRASLLRGMTVFDFRGPEGNGLGTARNPQRAVTMPGYSKPSPLGPTPAPFYVPARAKDGVWMQWANFSPHLFWAEADMLGLAQLKDDEEYAQLPREGSGEVMHAWWQLVLERMQERTSEEWMAIARERGTAGLDIFTETWQGMDHPQARFNGDVITVDDPEFGPSEQVGYITKLSQTPSSVGVKPWATAVHTEPADVDRGHGRTAGKPLDGILLLEAATMIATPTGAVALADLGARVIKIEPLDGDPGRVFPFIKMVQDKESLAVDLKSPEGLQVVHRLAARADMFLHNYRPGVPQRLGIDYETLKKHNPKIIYAYAGAYGTDGPYVKMPAFHPVPGAVCGNAVLQAGEGALDRRPDISMDELKARSLRLFRANEGHPDPVTGVVVASALMLGLVARDRFGFGQDMTSTMLGANAYLMSDDWIRYEDRPRRQPVDADLLGTGPLNRLYETSEGWVYLACMTERDWAGLVDLLGVELAGDDRFKTADSRSANAAALADTLGRLLATRSAEEWEATAVPAGVACVRADRCGFQQFQRNDWEVHGADMCVEAESVNVGTHLRANAMVDMDGVGGRIPMGGAAVAGQHTVPILRELGYTDDEIDSLLDRKVVHSPDI